MYAPTTALRYGVAAWPDFLLPCNLHAHHDSEAITSPHTCRSPRQQLPATPTCPMSQPSSLLVWLQCASRSSSLALQTLTERWVPKASKLLLVHALNDRSVQTSCISTCDLYHVAVVGMLAQPTTLV